MATKQMIRKLFANRSNTSQSLLQVVVEDKEDRIIRKGRWRKGGDREGRWVE